MDADFWQRVGLLPAARLVPPLVEDQLPLVNAAGGRQWEEMESEDMRERHSWVLHPTPVV